MNYTKEYLILLKEANKKICLDDSTIQNIVFIYSPPKVGSTTLVSSIRLSATHIFKVLHIHDEVMLQVLTGINNVTINQLIQYNKYIGRNIWVIDIYRSPIERKMSEFFDKLCSTHFNNTENNIINYDSRRFITRFNNIFAYIANGDHYIEKYINVIPKPEKFDFNKKYLLRIVDGIKYIKLRLKDSNEWEMILNDLLGIRITIVNDYEKDKTSLATLYNKFKNQYKIPSNYLNNIQNCPYLNYYYSPQEKEEYIQYWSKKQEQSYYGYSVSEYEIYKNICIENKWYNDVQHNHYLDEGCSCTLCSNKRNTMIHKIRNGNINSIYNNKIIHNEIIYDKNEIIQKVNNIIQNSNKMKKHKNEKTKIINTIFVEAHKLQNFV